MSDLEALGVSEQFGRWPLTGRTGGGNMIDRRSLLLEEISRTGSVNVSVVASKFEVSNVTIRGDLNELARAGAIVRTRGGAVSRTMFHLAATVTERSIQHTEQKSAIAEEAVRSIMDGETVLLDAGTTTLQIARRIPAHLRLTLLTTSLDIASELSGRANIELYMLGGQVNRQERSVYGAVTEAQLADVMAHRAFIGANTIDHHFDVVDISMGMARLKRALMARSRHNILVADSSKWGMDASSKAASLTDFDSVVSDINLDVRWRQYMDDNRISYTLVEPDVAMKD